MKVRYLKEFVVESKNLEARQGALCGGNPLPPPLGVIKVIHTASMGIHVSKRRGGAGCSTDEKLHR